MKVALLKELRLVVHPSTYFIVVLGALVLIPSWMYGAIFIYGVLVAFFNGMTPAKCTTSSTRSPSRCLAPAWQERASLP